MNKFMADIVYKILPQADWLALERDGQLPLTGTDARDGFVHLSTAQQLAGTLQQHFAGADNLVLLALDATQIATDLKWEASRNGGLFPHLYAPLSRPHIIADFALDDTQNAPVLSVAARSWIDQNQCQKQGQREVVG